jgi:hypothetical protein
MLNATEYHKVGRPKNRNPTRKVEPVLPAGAYACLHDLAGMAHYGSTPNEVARYLILRGLDDLMRSGVIHGGAPDIVQLNGWSAQASE